MGENNKKTYDFYKSYYDKNRVSILQYNSLRKNFQKMVKNVLGSGYYNTGMDVYECDRLICEDITRKATMKRKLSLLKFWK